MNRSLAIPAAGCCVAFVALLATLHVATGRETATDLARSRVASLDREVAPVLPPASFSASIAEGDQLLSPNDAQQLLAALSGEYLRPWRQWQTSPRRMYSRAAVRPVPSISAEIILSSSDEEDPFLLATVAITTGRRTDAVPAVVDRTTKQVRLFSDGQWLTQAEWIKKAPLP
jgi:hypothetical protein